MNRHTCEVLEFPRVVALLRAMALSPSGASLAGRLLPSGNSGEVKAAQKELAEAMGFLDRKGEIPLGGAIDVSEVLSRASIEGACLDVAGLLDLHRMARTADDVKRFLGGEEESSPLLSGLAARLDPLTGLQMEIARCIDEEGRVVDRASPSLAAIRSEMEETRADVRRILERHLRSKRLRRSLQEEIVTLRNGRYVLPVKEGDRRAVEGIVHDHSGSGATVFVEPMETVEKNNRLARLHREEKREIVRILRALTDRVREAAPSIESNGEALARLDFAQAKARLARGMEGRIPRIEEGAPLRIERGRHPLLEASLRQAGRGEELVPLDLAYPDEARTVVLTGPNAGGKTVALKTVGLFALMAQAGLALPAGEGTSLPLFRKIYADIGDEQSIENSLSSFSAHIRQIARIVGDAGEGSLVLLDEIGRGTDPAEGSALAMSVLEEIDRRGALSLVTTHLGSLKVFVHDRPSMANASMEFDRGRLWPTYRLEVGLPGTSHALEIAARLGIPAPLIERARGFAGFSEAEIESLVADLKERERHLAGRERSAREERERLERLAGRLGEEEEGVRRERKRWERERLSEAKRYLDESRALVEEVVRKIRTGGARREEIREGRRAIEKERRRLAGRLRASAAGKGPAGGRERFAVGAAVHVPGMNRDGVIVGWGNREGRVLVETGGIRLEIDTAELGPARGGRKARPAAPALERPAPEGRHEIDLRGLRAEEARRVVDKFLDHAVLSGVPSVRIIHGVGTGALMSEVAALLEEDPRVGSFRLGDSGGFTVVEM